MATSFSLARSCWSGSVAQLMIAGDSRPFVQPYFESISTYPHNTGLPMGGLGNSFTLTPAGTTPVLNLLPGLHVTPIVADHLRLHNFFYCERELPSAATLMFPDYYAFQRRSRLYPLYDAKGQRWLTGEEDQERALQILRCMLATPSLHRDNAASFARWRIDWSSRTRRAIEAGDTSERANLLLLLDFYASTLGVEHRFGRSLTGDSGRTLIDGWETYRADLMQYRALYPLAETEYRNRRQALGLLKRTFTPLVPGDPSSCQLPVSLVDFEITNPCARALEATLLQTLDNLCGYEIVKQRVGLQDGWFRLVPTARFMQHELAHAPVDGRMQLTAIVMGQAPGVTSGDLSGRMLAGVYFDGEDEDVCVSVNAAYSKDRIEHVVSDGMHSGRLTPAFDKSLYTGREPLTGALCATLRVPPRTTKRVTFVLVLDFADIRLPGNHTRKRYAAQFADTPTRTLDLALAGVRARERSLQAAQQWHRALEASIGLDWLYPPRHADARDRFLTCLANLLGFYADAAVWTEQDELLIRESADYPFFNVLDVYFYGVFSLRWLLPHANASILRRFAAAILAEDPTLRRYWQFTEEPHADLPDPKLEGPRAIRGAVPHDLGSAFDCRPDAYIWHNVKEWKDLAPKYVLLVLQEFRYGGDETFLQQCWPAVYEALEYLSAKRAEGESIPRTRGSDDTFDNLASYGISVYSGSLWIAGLEAGIEIARLLGHEAQARPWRELATRARKELVDALWDEEAGYYHFCVSPASASDLEAEGEQGVRSLLRRLGWECDDLLITVVNRFIEQASPSQLDSCEWDVVLAWASAHMQAVIPLIERREQTLARKERRALNKVVLAALVPHAWSQDFAAGILRESDDVLAAQLLADTWLEMLGLPTITPLQRRRRILARIRTLNFLTHSADIGAANLVSRSGESLSSWQAQDVWLGVQFALVAAMILADMPEEARELNDICCLNLYEKARIPFAAPEGFNGNSPLCVADLRDALKLKQSVAEELHAALRDIGCLDRESRVSARLPATAEQLLAALPQHLPLRRTGKQGDALLRLLRSWRLRYTAGRYHRPGMAFGVLEALKVKLGRQQSAVA